MKKYICISLMLLGVFSLRAQNKYTAKADKLFDDLKYVAAIDAYLEVIKDGNGDDYVNSRLADTYYNVFNTKKAEEYLAKVVGNSKNAEDYFKYAQMLKANGKYDAAKTWMDKFSEKKPNDVRAIAHIKSPNVVADLLADSSEFKITAIEGFNSEFSEFGLLVFKGQVYYTSARSGKGRNYGWTKEPYLDIYVSDYDATTGELTNETVLGSEINTKFNEGTVSFSPDGKTIYFSGESVNRSASLFGKKFKKDKGGKSTINIYSATKVGDKWGNVKTLPFNNETSNASGPAVSADAKRLYFSSDMEGTMGKADLWYVTINEDGTYGLPVNLGKTINTEGSEMFPYISSKNVLYFASNGHPGLGMLDIFASEINGDNFESVKNIGAPINSGNDDFSYTIDEDSQKGFFASNREGGSGSDDIYAFEQIVSICDLDVSVQILDAKTNAILPYTEVVIYDENRTKVADKVSDEGGFVHFKYECNRVLKVEANREMYAINSVEIATTNVGDVNKILALSPIIVENKVVLNPIFFELDKHNITAQGASELDKLVEVMHTYPHMIIQATSHTDSRGKDVYNMALSDRRAKATAQYVISKGIDASRISGQGKGETELINKCSNGVKCTEEEHQANRRSEFIITNLEEAFNKH
ncbi:MAG: OmpA family protein [Flavobacteriaceae bacterium]|nr:OmpA family protein [Flavobacteriaceae bacterium]